MEWIGQKVFKRGYWKSREERWMEVEILDVEEGGQLTDGIIEDEDDEEDGHSHSCVVSLSTVVDGFTWVEGTCEWRVEGVLEVKVMRWLEGDHHEHEEEEQRQCGCHWTDDCMDVNVDDEDADESSEQSEDDENDSEEVKDLKTDILEELALHLF
ncbi:hypothetical protein DFJ58DRAFT_737458 [Suillus subalutaceus]|uniref:uncharacterized protein n=1 Tax=Suillus subalutaceus TaxID=48586 RepID=UPI001B85CA50|nr:uncharacterized protein DFJ58DRAFT_737458 [Suillus subalutaceus]KAG1829220.1 hypothetical protein DFJ58DRAFT_737458 [Suillus subalutaceus]